MTLNKPSLKIKGLSYCNFVIFQKEVRTYHFKSYIYKTAASQGNVAVQFVQTIFIFNRNSL